MTTETRTFISPNDIAGLEYECRRCKARHMVPIGRFDRVLYACPNCKEGLAIPMEAHSGKANDESPLHAFVSALKGLQGLSFKLRLEITEPEMPANDK